ncbi:MAG: thioredoxin domain-containing protein [Bacteroidota bacterium]
MTLKTLILFISFATSLFSCNSQNTSVKTLKPSDFEKGISQDNILLVDVRTPKEYAEKRILNSNNVNINDAHFEKQMNQLDKSKPLYLYCLVGARSGKAAEWAVKNGFKEVYNLEGGITAWMGEKKPVEVSTTEAKTEGLNFDDYLNHIKASDKLVLVDFNAVWCGPCKILKPIVQKYAKKNSAQVDLFEIDVDKNPEVANTMNIRSIPLLLLYRDGKEVWRNKGLIDENELAGKLNQFLM